MKIKIYKEQNEFVLERINEFGHSFINRFVTKEGLLECVDIHLENRMIDGFDDFEVSPELWTLVVLHIQKRGVVSNKR